VTAFLPGRERPGFPPYDALMCSCGKGTPKQSWRITYPNGTSIVTTSTATKVMAEASGAKVEAITTP